MAEIPPGFKRYFGMSRATLLDLFRNHPLLNSDPQLLYSVGDQQDVGIIRESIHFARYFVSNPQDFDRPTKFQVMNALHDLDCWRRQSSFPQFTRLPDELKDQILDYLWIRSPAERQQCHPSSLRLTRALREQGESVVHGQRGGNTITILLYSDVVTAQRAVPSFLDRHGNVVPASPRVDKYHTAAWVYLGEKLPDHERDTTSKLVFRFDAEGLDLAELVDTWPLFVRKTVNINVVIKLSAANASKKKPHEFLERHPYLQMNYLVYSLAYSATACKKLNVTLRADSGGMEEPKSQALILAGLCVFRNVRNFSMIGMDTTYARHLKAGIEGGTHWHDVLWTTSGASWDRALPSYHRLQLLLRLARITYSFVHEDQVRLDDIMLAMRNDFLTTIEYGSNSEEYAPHNMDTNMNSFLDWLKSDIFDKHAVRIVEGYHEKVKEMCILPLFLGIGGVEKWQDENGTTAKHLCEIWEEGDRGDWILKANRSTS